MSDAVSRRDALKRFGTAGGGAVLTRGIIRGQSSDIVVAGKPVEIVVSEVSRSTVRLTILPIDRGRLATVPEDGALVPDAGGRRQSRRRAADRFDPIRTGNLTVRFTSAPPTLHVETTKGEAVQRLALDASARDLSFLLGNGPLLGLGQGPFLAAAPRTTAGQTTAACRATGRTTSRSTISGSTVGGPIRAMTSTRRRASTATECTGKDRSCGGPMSGRLRCTAMGMRGCNATPRFSGQATCSLAGRR